MKKFLGMLQITLALALLVIVGATVVNIVLIAGRPESVSVANSLIGQTLIAVCLLALARLLWRWGLERVRERPFPPST